VSDLDTRMRRLFEGVDTSPGFEARVLARVASLESDAAAALRNLAERRRALEQRWLRRESWMNAVTAAGIGAAGIAVVWRNGPSVVRWVEDSSSLVSDPSLLMGFALAVLALGLWPALRSLLPR
jgi:ferric-dicitrate binding protein FerR (iron transport regulator)